MVFFCCMGFPIFPIGFFVFFLVCIILYQLIKISDYAKKGSEMKVKLRKGRYSTNKKEYKPDIGIILIPGVIILIVFALFSFLFMSPLIGPLIFLVFLLIICVYGALYSEMNTKPIRNRSIVVDRRIESVHKSLKQKEEIKKNPKFNDSHFCSKCGMKYAKDALFCHNCGKSLNTEVRFCQYCGILRIKDGIFCHKCGNLIVSILGVNSQHEDKKTPKAQEEVGFCNSCGAERESEREEFYCSDCGVRFQE